MPKLDCEHCGGTGWLVSEHEGYSAADRCSCVNEVNPDLVEERSRVPKTFLNASLEDGWILPHDNPSERLILAQAMTAVMGYIREYPKLKKPGLLFVGPTGVGKTHLAVAALRSLLARGHDGVFFDYQNLLEQIRSGYDELLGTSNREAYRSALETEILLLDDLGAHRVSDWVEDTVTGIITARYNQGKALIATTNLADPDYGGVPTETEKRSGVRFRTLLEQRVGERARSRLFEMCTVVKLWGVSDHRVQRRS